MRKGKAIRTVLGVESRRAQVASLNLLVKPLPRVTALALLIKYSRSL